VPRLRRAVIAGGLLILTVGERVEAQDEREHFQLKLGATYEQGDFGSQETTHSVYAPITFRYLGERFDVAVTHSLVYLDAPRGVTLVEGAPQVTDEAEGGRETAFGVGDTVFKFRYFLVDDRGPDSWVPSLTPFVKLKIPTADDDRGLGTGKPDGGFGLEWDKQIGRMFVFGDAAYTFMGDPSDTNFRDRPAASVGVGIDVTETLTTSLLLDWRRALVSGNDDPLEVLGIVTVRLSPVLRMSPYLLVGLSDGSPDFGIGFEISYRFGRW
jgi:hypothetical protein